MSRSSPRLLGCAALALTAACVPATRSYSWGNYDQALYRHYKAPGERARFVEELKVVILQAEQAGQKMPPGLYAEYGYALYEEGQRDGAVQYFGKEKALWPESQVFMDKMIQNAQRQPAAPAGAKGEAAAAEGGAK